MPTSWRCLEDFRCGLAVAADWQRALDGDFGGFKSAFLQPAGTSTWYPCPHGCGCTHSVVHLSADRIKGVCACDPWNCDDIALRPEDIVLWQFNRTRLGRALCRVLNIDRREADTGVQASIQVGVFAATVPVILTIQPDPDDFRSVIAQLVARLPDGFVLFAPTSRFLDAGCQELLAKARAGLLDLETHIRLTARGDLATDLRPAELFALALKRPPQPVEEDAVQKAFAIVKTLDSEKPLREASLLKVFRLYCVAGLSAEAVAKKCGCSKGTIINRLEIIRQRTGVDPAQLRTYSAQFDRIDDSLADPRARRIRRQEAMYNMAADSDG